MEPIRKYVDAVERVQIPCAASSVLDAKAPTARALYENLHCAPGDMGNRIRDRKLFLSAGRTSSATLRANQLHLYFPAFAGVLVNILRRIGLRGTALANLRAAQMAKAPQSGFRHEGCPPSAEADAVAGRASLCAMRQAAADERVFPYCQRPKNAANSFWKSPGFASWMRSASFPMDSGP